jgi:nucleoside-diphosphate-sugar epimerase
MLSGSTFLLTGATGRLGAALTCRIEELGAHVVPLVLGGYPDRPRRIPWPARTAPLRISRPGDIQELPRPDYIINCHWEVARDLRFAEQLAFEIDRNLRAMDALWDWLAFHRPRAFVNVSSIKIFGPFNTGPISSETEPRPVTPYGIAKLAAEKFFDAHFRGSGVSVGHLRLCSVMAAGSHPSQLASRLISSMFQGQTIQINKGHLNYVLYIDEVVDLLVEAAVRARSGRFNIVSAGSPNETIAELFGRIAGREINAEYTDLAPGAEDPVYVSDADEFRAGWVRRTSLEDAIRKTVALSSRLRHET